MLDNAHFRSLLSRFFAGKVLCLTATPAWALAAGYFDPTWAVTQTNYGRISFTVDATNSASVTSIVLEGSGNMLLDGSLARYRKSDSLYSSALQSVRHRMIMR